jgi:hypothetical protein
MTLGLWQLVALVGWVLALVFAMNARHYEAMMRKSWERENWYRDLLRKPIGPAFESQVRR